MTYKIFNIPIPDSNNELEIMNKFLGGVRIVSVQKEIAVTGGLSYWSFVIEFFKDNVNTNLARKNKIDYREVLSEEDFAVYSTLRELRKQVAENDGVPVYAVFTNEQLSLLVIKRITTKNALSNISGIGEKKVASYGDIFIQKLKGIYETGREPL